MVHPYKGITVALSTKHSKEHLIAPILAKLGIKTEHQEWDTDQLGTFSPETPRTLSQRDTAIKKARIGMSKSGCNYGIASEGSVGADPILPLVNSTLEMIAWVDDVNEFELVEYERGLEVVATKKVFKEGDDLEKFLRSADFPNHALIVYPEGGKGPIYKGLRGREELEVALKDALAKSNSESAMIESDLRAHMSPSRAKAIISCAEKLVARLAELCPTCNLPGFGKVENLAGLNCEECGEVVPNAIRGEILGCVKCDHKIEKLNGKTKVSPANCLVCNP
jgi:hypothetical protein